MLKGILLSLVLSAAWITVHIILFHLRRPEKMFKALLCLFAPTMPLFAICYFLTPDNLYLLPATCSRTPASLGVVNGLFVHLLLFGTYVEFFYYVTRAVTLRILVEVLTRGGAHVGLGEIQGEYNISTMVLSRLEAMVENGFVHVMHGNYYNTPKGHRYARFFIFFRRMLKLEDG